MGKNEKRLIAVQIILLLLFAVISFAPPFSKGVVFWIAFVLGVAAIGAQYYTMKTAFGEESAKSRFYGFPVARIGVIYLIVQMVLSILFMAIGRICPTWIAIIVFALVLAFAGIGLIAADVAKEEVVKLEQQFTADVSRMKELRMMTAALPELTEDAECKQKLTELAEEFRYSDPVSSDAVKELENDLMELVEELQKSVTGGETNEIEFGVKKIKLALAERNRMCKQNK